MEDRSVVGDEVYDGGNDDDSELYILVTPHH